MSVQAVIAALNQQSNQTEIHPNYKINASLKRSSTKSTSSTSTTTDLASIRNRFNNNSSNDHELIKKKSSASTLKETNLTKNEKSSSSTTSTNSTIKVANKYRTDKSFNTENKDPKLLTLEKQLEKVTLERDSLQQQLSQCHCHYNNSNNSNNTPYNSGSMVSHGEHYSSNQLWFEMNHDATNGDDYDYEEFITHYHQTTSQSISNYRQQIDQLKRQLAACEIGTQWMMGKYLGELERERLHTKSLKTIVQSQETLIHTMENNYKHNSTSSTLPSSFSTSSMASIASNHHHSQQQYFLLRSQVDLQKMELDDQQDIIHMLMEERELLIKKLNHKSIHLHQQKRRSRAISSSSSTSTSSTSSSSSSSPVRPYSPPHTPPPFDRLPALPTSSSFSSTISSTSTATEPITPPSSQRPSMITFDHKPIIHEYNSNDDENEYENEVGHNKKINDFPPPQRQSSLLHKSSMPDIRSIHYSSLNSPRTSLGQHPSSMDPYLLLSSKKSLSRQRSFWKGWKQRLSN